MWFHADRDPKVILKSVWTIARWLLFGPLVGGGLLALVGLLLVGWEGAVNGLFTGLAFGAMGGVMTAGSKALSEMD
jgi:hypothetical protein